MKETVEIKKDVDVECFCNACGKELTISCVADHFGDISCDVDICECAEEEEDQP